MINPKINISSNLFTLRKYHKWSQEEVADKVGVSRQAIAKWELGESVPDIIHCDALAKLYDVTLMIYSITMKQKKRCRFLQKANIFLVLQH